MFPLCLSKLFNVEDSKDENEKNNCFIFQNLKENL